MADIVSKNIVYSLEPRLYEVFAKYTVGGSGALTVVNCPYITSVTRNGAGDYSFLFRDVWNECLDVKITLKSTTASTYVAQIHTDSLNSAKTLRVVLTVGGSATDPTNGATAYFHFVLKNSKEMV